MTYKPTVIDSGNIGRCSKDMQKTYETIVNYMKEEFDSVIDCVTMVRYSETQFAVYYFVERTMRGFFNMVDLYEDGNEVQLTQGREVSRSTLDEIWYLLKYVNDAMQLDNAPLY